MGSVYSIKERTSFKHVGSVHAFDKEMVVQNARDLYTRRGEGKGMWVVPASSIAVDPSDDQSFFEPADDKFIVIQLFMNYQMGLKICKYDKSDLFKFCLRLGDSCLIMAHRQSEMCIKVLFLKKI